MARNISQKLEMANIPIKVAEKSGPKICQLLVQTNPHQAQLCDREDCPVCSSWTEEDKGRANCHQEGVVYAMECEVCQAKYIGETSSTSYVRGKEHTYAYKLHSEGKVGGNSSVLGRHVREKHGDNHNIKFSMRVLAHYLSLTHQRHW